MTWRVAESLLQLRAQVNAKWPARAKGWDGTIGDEAHASRSSDHNPWFKEAGIGIVTAEDITHDPASGCDSYALAQALLNSRDSRIKYIISNRRIASGDAGPSPWVWRKYSGANPHDHHCHISIKADKAHYDSKKEWVFDIGKVPVEPSPPIQPNAPKPRPTLHSGSRGDDVKFLQTKLGIRADGIYGLQTVRAVQAIQNKRRIVADGICGPQTWKIINE